MNKKKLALETLIVRKANSLGVSKKDIKRAAGFRKTGNVSNQTINNRIKRLSSLKNSDYAKFYQKTLSRQSSAYRKYVMEELGVDNIKDINFKTIKQRDNLRLMSSNTYDSHIWASYWDGDLNLGEPDEASLVFKRINTKLDQDIIKKGDVFKALYGKDKDKAKTIQLIASRKR